MSLLSHCGWKRASALAFQRLCASTYAVARGQDHLTIGKDGKQVQFHFQWLRDHCRNPSVYNHSTHQRNISLLEFGEDVSPASYNVEKDTLKIQWTDNHQTEYDLLWLLSEVGVGQRSDGFLQKVSRKVWAKDTFPQQDATVDYETLKKDPTPVAASILRNGFALVTGVGASTEATRECVESLVPVCHTIYGDMFELFSDQQKDGVSDSSYSKVALGPHTDTTYYQEALGLQVFHCLEASPVGGETILVDGFKVAEIVKNAEDRDMYNFLSQVPLEAEYIHDDPRDHFYVLDTVFKHHPLTGQLEQFRYNVYDRGVHKMTLDEQRKFYKYYRYLSQVVSEPANAAWLKLQPGTVLFIDNWRVMHGRAAYKGTRKLCGCYVGRTEFMSRAKVLGLV